MKVITAIILSYNNGKMLFETIDSVLKQDYESIEIIIADDCSQQFSIKEVTNYIASKKCSNIINIIVYQNDSNIGTVRSLNRAIKKSSGDFIKIIAGDDAYPSNNVFSRHELELEQNQDSLFVVGNLVQCDFDLKPQVSLGFFNHPVEYSKGVFKKKDIKKLIRLYPYLLSIQSITFRKELFEKVGLFDERYKLVEDLPFLIKVIDNHICFSYINIDSVFHRNDVGVSSNKVNRFDLKKVDYYKDILNYHIFELSRYKRIIGRFFFFVKKSISDFRVQYTKTRSKKVVIKFLPALFLCLFIRK